VSLFNTSIAQYVSAYLAIIRYIKIVVEIVAILYTVVTRVATFSQFYDLNLKSEIQFNLRAACVAD
jgi:hypothetical protein